MTRDAALLELLNRLKAIDYRFMAVTPATHSRVLARPQNGPLTLRVALGWNRSFHRGDIDPAVVALLEEAGALIAGEATFRSAVRVASLGNDLFLHSSFPTASDDSVFFGPDTYRFARFLDQQLRMIESPRHVVDMGAGSGAGGIVCAHAVPGAKIMLVDINPAALRLAAINAASAGVEVELSESGRIPAAADLVIANPPYMADSAHRTYRDGGGLLGGELALDWAAEAIGALRPGGTLLLYTGAAIVDGRSPILDALDDMCRGAGAFFEVEEIDPDVFGEELDTPAYAEVERIAAVGIRIDRPR